MDSLQEADPHPGPLPFRKGRGGIVGSSLANQAAKHGPRVRMYRLRKIESFDLPEVQPYRTMRRQHEHREQGIFVAAEGEKVVRRLLESKFSVVSVLLPEKWLPELEPLLQARPEHIQVFVAEKALLETLTGFSMYQGLLAVGKVPTTAVAGGSYRTQPAAATPGGSRWPLQRRESRRAGPQLRGLQRPGLDRRGNLQQPLLTPRRAELDGDPLPYAHRGNDQPAPSPPRPA